LVFSLFALTFHSPPHRGAARGHFAVIGGVSFPPFHSPLHRGAARGVLARQSTTANSSFSPLFIGEPRAAGYAIAIHGTLTRFSPLFIGEPRAAQSLRRLRREPPVSVPSSSGRRARPYC